MGGRQLFLLRGKGPSAGTQWLNADMSGAEKAFRLGAGWDSLGLCLVNTTIDLC